VADEHHLLLAQVRQPGDDGLVVADGPVAVQLDDLLEDQLQVVPALRTLGVARDLDGLPGVEVGEDRPLQPGQVAADAADLVGQLGGRGVDARAGLGQQRLHLRQPRLHLVDRRLEGEAILGGAGHRRGGPREGAGSILGRWIHHAESAEKRREKTQKNGEV
jgi:hypothetical protein